MTAGADEKLPRRHPQVLICTSPKAGSGVGREAIGALSQRLAVDGIQVEVTTSVPRVREVAQAAANQSPDVATQLVVVAAGGDGTLSLVAQHTPPGTVLVPMPLGTENLLARHFGFTRQPEALRDTIMLGPNRPLDVGLANGRMFLVMVSCGFDAEVVRAMHLTRRGHINRLSYFRPIWRAVRRYRFPKLTVQWLNKRPRNTLQRTNRKPRLHQRRTILVGPCALTCLAMPLRCELRPVPAGTMASWTLSAFSAADCGTACGIWAELLWSVILNGVMWFGVHCESCRITSSVPVAYQIDGDYGGRLPLEIQVSAASFDASHAPATSSGNVVTSTAASAVSGHFSTTPAVAPVTIGPLVCGDGPLTVIAGPCVLQSLELALQIAHSLAETARRRRINLVFKASFDKANRTSLKAERGTRDRRGAGDAGQSAARDRPADKTDIHLPDQAAKVAEVCDLLQIPAFLARQTDLLVAPPPRPESRSMSRQASSWLPRTCVMRSTRSRTRRREMNELPRTA